MLSSFDQSGQKFLAFHIECIEVGGFRVHLLSLHKKQYEFLIFSKFLWGKESLLSSCIMYHASCIDEGGGAVVISMCSFYEDIILVQFKLNTGMEVLLYK